MESTWFQCFFRVESLCVRRESVTTCGFLDVKLRLYTNSKSQHPASYRNTKSLGGASLVIGDRMDGGPAVCEASHQTILEPIS